MKLWSLIILTLISLQAIGEDKKIYSQKEFDKKLKEKINATIDNIKKKSIAQLTKDILEKERKLDEREKLVAQKEEQIKISEQSLTKNILEHENEKKKILGCINENQGSESRRVNQLVEMISNMKPVKAAELLSVQDSEISVKIIEKIEPSKASKIFNMMDKEVSARLQKQYLNMKQ